MNVDEFGPLDAALQAAVVRADTRQEQVLTAGLDEASRPAPIAPTALQAAQWYASIGLAVFPLKCGEKRPLERTNGFKDATTNLAGAEQWWDATWNLGIPTGGRFDVIDIDGAEGAASFVRTLTSGQDTSWLTVHAVAQTPRGLHLWVDSVGAPNGANLAPGVDYRGAGGYVVVPPSIVSGRLYRWLVPPS